MTELSRDKIRRIPGSQRSPNSHNEEASDMRLPTCCAISTLTFLLAATATSALMAGDVEDNRNVRSSILRADKLFWEAYNSCDLDRMEDFLTEDLEFYHDKSGFTKTRESFMKSVEKGMCGMGSGKQRREAVEESLKVHVLGDYGAILMGEHRFYLTENGTEERRDGMASFTHVWQRKNDEWKMSRVLSYDHRPVTHSEAAFISEAALEACAGTYETQRMGSIVVAKERLALAVKANGFQATIFPANETNFHHKERDLTFEFVKGGDDVIRKMIIREHGEVVDEANKTH
jgi:ketosteroid isomerase-like protein